MGSMLLSGWLTEGAFSADQLLICDTNPAKIAPFLADYPALRQADAAQIAEACDEIIICVEPSAVAPVLCAMDGHLRPETFLMISTATVAYEDLELLFPGAISKFMPSLNGKVKSGGALLCHNEKTSPDQRARILGLLDTIFTEVFEIPERDMQMVHLLTGSMPAFVAELIERFAIAADESGFSLSREKLTEIITLSFFGASRLIRETDLSPQAIIKGVSTPGGITFEGITLMEKALPPMLSELFSISLDKYNAITARAHEQIAGIVAGASPEKSEE